MTNIKFLDTVGMNELLHMIFSFKAIAQMSIYTPRIPRINRVERYAKESFGNGEEKLVCLFYDSFMQIKILLQSSNE